MQHVSTSSNITGAHTRRSTGRGGVAYPEVEDGMPVDRTVCPRCLGLEGEAHTCRVCHGQPVCPGCRNARLVRSAGESVNYDVCPDCCERLSNSDGGTERFPSGAPRWLWYPARQRAAVAAYQARRRDAYYRAADERDPWDTAAAS